MSLVLDAYGRPVLHPGDVIAIRLANGQIREPLRVTRIVPPTISADSRPNMSYRIYFKYAMDSKEDYEFAHDIEVKLLAKADHDAAS